MGSTARKTGCTLANCGVSVQARSQVVTFGAFGMFVVLVVFSPFTSIPEREVHAPHAPSFHKPHMTEEGTVEYSGPERAFCAKVAWQGAWLAGGVRPRRLLGNFSTWEYTAGSFVQKIMPQLQLGGDLTLAACSDVMMSGRPFRRNVLKRLLSGQLQLRVTVLLVIFELGNRRSASTV